MIKDNFVWSKGQIGLCEVFQKIGKELFGRKWIGCELDWEKVDFYAPIYGDDIFFFRHWESLASGIACIFVNENLNKKLLKKHIQNGVEELKKDYYGRNYTSSDSWIEYWKFIVDEKILYKGISAKKGGSEIVCKNIIEFIVKYETVKLILENLIYLKICKPWIRYHGTGKEEQVSDEYLNKECDVGLRNFVFSKSFGELSKCSHVGNQERLTYEKVTIFFKKEEVDVKKLLFNFKKQDLKTPQDKKDLLKRFAEHGYLPKYIEIVIKAILDYQITDENQGASHQKLWRDIWGQFKEKEKKDLKLTETFVKQIATIIRRHDKKGQNTRAPKKSN